MTPRTLVPQQFRTMLYIWQSSAGTLVSVVLVKQSNTDYVFKHFNLPMFNYEKIHDLFIPLMCFSSSKLFVALGSQCDVMCPLCDFSNRGSKSEGASP